MIVRIPDKMNNGIFDGALDTPFRRASAPEHLPLPYMSSDEDAVFSCAAYYPALTFFLFD